MRLCDIVSQIPGDVVLVINRKIALCGYRCNAALCGGAYSANEGVVWQSHVSAGRLWAGVSEDRSDGQEVTSSGVHGGAASVPEGVPGPSGGECSREPLRDVPSREMPAVLPRE